MTTRSKKRKNCNHIVYNEHHPDRTLYPDWTIRVRRNHHLFLWRQVQSLRNDVHSLIDLMNLKQSIDYEVKRRIKELYSQPETPFEPL